MANFISTLTAHKFIVQEVISAHKQKEGVEIVNVRKRNAQGNLLRMWSGM
jgi:hypothetical protein